MRHFTTTQDWTSGNCRRYSRAAAVQGRTLHFDRVPAIEDGESGCVVGQRAGRRPLAAVSRALKRSLGCQDLRAMPRYSHR
jgi:hypothetical protein